MLWSLYVRVFKKLVGMCGFEWNGTASFKTFTLEQKAMATGFLNSYKAKGCCCAIRFGLLFAHLVLILF